MTVLNFKPMRPGNLMRNFGQLPAAGNDLAQPVVNILITKDGFRIDLAAPGLQKEDFKLKMEENDLVVSASPASNQAEVQSKFHRKEFSPIAFERIFRVPETIDTNKVTANYINGILVIQLVNKAEKKATTKTIVVQ